MSGIVSVFTPRGLPGLELGGGGFFQSRWPATGLGLDELMEPFGALFKVNTRDPDDTQEEVRSTDQRASLFMRWVAPRSGFELYGTGWALTGRG